MKRYFIFILTGLISAVSLSQTINTPEVFSFKQEVFRPVSYYTGQADISVPLCQIHTNEMTIPISLTYIGGEGLRPINPYSNVGMGWKVSSGGAITRSVNQVPDESAYQNQLSGFFNLPVNTTTNDWVRNNASSLLVTDPTYGVKFSPQYEYAPDLFSFSFLGYSGSFMMGYDKQFHIQSKDIVKVEKGTTTILGTTPMIYFILTANDGTKFTFGYTDGSIEISGAGTGVPFDPYQANAWYLTNILFSNGRSINFSYQPTSGNMMRYHQTSYDTSWSIMYPVVLDKITYNGGQVLFTSSARTQSIAGANDNLKLIDKIELQNSNNETISKTSFNYSSQISNRYYILDSLKIDDRHYAFGYNNIASLPGYAIALKTDYWGFYNAQDESPLTVGFDSFLNQDLAISYKMPSESNTKLGILTSLKFPTGETEYYEYEANTYSNKKWNGANGYTLYFQSDAIPKTGGLRIAKITRGNEVRKYKYVLSLDPNNPDYDPAKMSPINYYSSGILYKMPAVTKWDANVVNAISSEGEPPITYSKVYELRSDKSYTVYNMTSEVDYPDISNATSPNYYSMFSWNGQYVMTDALYSYISKSTMVNALGKNSSRALERGKISSTQIYDSSNNLKRSTTYTYNQDPNRYSQYVTGINMVNTAPSRIQNLALTLQNTYSLGSGFCFSLLHSYCTYTFPVLLTKEETTDYYPTSSVTRTTRYNYNNQLLQSCVTTYDSRGDSVRVQYRYPADINTGVYASMTNLNMLNFPIEQTTLKNTSITGSKLTTYKSNSSSYVPDKSYSLEITSPLSSFTYYNGSAMDSHYGTTADISYDIYSTHNNVKQVTGRNGTSTSYLWDATDTYPMSQVKGAPFSLISSFDGKDAAYASNTLWSSLNGLSSSIQVSTYSYKPLVGITSSVNPQGVSTNYTYDTYNRLYLVRNDDKNLLTRYSYGYQKYPDNGQGGYATLSASLPYLSTVIKGVSMPVTVTTSGGTGNLTYNWYLKYNGVTVASTLNGSTSYNLICSQAGSYYLECDVIDNLTGNQIVCTTSFQSYVAVCSVSLRSGYTSVNNTVYNSGTSGSLSLSFYSSSAMSPNTSYWIGNIASGCRPSSTRVATSYSVMGRTWQVSIYSNGDVYLQMTTGTTMPAYYSEWVAMSYTI